MDLFNHPNIERMASEHDYDGLYKCLENRDPIIQLQAAQALAEMNDGAGWRFLIDAVRQTGDSDRQSAAAAIMGELGHPRAVPILGEVLLKQRFEPASSEAAEAIRDALEAIGGPEADEALRRAGYEPIITSPSASGVTEYEAHYVRPVLPRTDNIRYLTAQEHLNNAVDLRESEMTERGLVEDSIALWLEPRWGYAWYLRGVLFEDLDRPYEARLAYRHAVEFDPTLKEAQDALAELENEPLLTPDEVEPGAVDLLTGSLGSREWATRRDAAAGLGDLALRDQSQANKAADALIEMLGDEEREVRFAAIEALGHMDNRSAILPLIELEESSWLVRFSILQTLSQLGSVDGLVTILRREMNRIQERNPVFSSHKDPLLEVEYDLLMEIGVRALERTGDLESLLILAEANAWEELDLGDEEEEAEGYGEPDETEEDGEYEDEEEQVDEDLTSYVDEVALMGDAALERLAIPKISTLSAGILQRLAVVPDLTLIDLTEDQEETPDVSIEETEAESEGEPSVVYDLSNLREAAKAELKRRGNA